MQRLVQVSVGHTAHLVCRFTGHPDTISWYHGHTPLVMGSRYSVTRYIHEDIGAIDSRLSIDKVTQHDYGYYLCTASNIYASTQATVQLYGACMFLYTVGQKVTILVGLTTCIANFLLCIGQCVPKIMKIG